MIYIKKIAKLIGLLLFAILFSVCMLVGVVPVLPKRKEQVGIEIKMEQEKENASNAEKIADYDVKTK